LNPQISKVRLMARVLKRTAARRNFIAQWVSYAENASMEAADRFLAAAEKTLARGHDANYDVSKDGRFLISV
jgi:hypothetical protein